MTYDDGIVTICTVTNGANTGDMPQKVLSEKLKSYFSFNTLGIQRYYTALDAKQQIEAVINIPDWQPVQVHDIAVLESGLQYIIQTVQPGWDNNGLKNTKLSLERLGEKYDYEDAG